MIRRHNQRRKNIDINEEGNPKRLGTEVSLPRVEKARLLEIRGRASEGNQT